MEEAEKMVALKKVYAEIILNTAKEAAARVMVSDRKALRSQQELFTVKEEALNMLLRLKQIMDLKIGEAEVASLSQQRRIEELEMQLHEAEEIVRELRSELKGVQDELARLKNNPGNLLDGKLVMGNATPPEEEAQEDKLHISDGNSCHLPDSECRPMSTCIMKNAPLNQSDDKCCSLSENGTARVETSSDSPVENYCAGNPDLACIIMRSNEPELYRNGCTQRIRAFEGNLLDGEKSPLPGHDDQCLHVKSGEKVEGTCTVSSPKTGIMTVVEKNLTESEEVMRHDTNCDKGQAGKFVQGFSKRRRRTRAYSLRNTISCRSLPDPCEPSFHSHTKTYPFLVNGNAESSEDPSRVSEDEAQRDSESHVDSQARDTKAGSPPNVTSKDSALVNESVLTSQESKAVENSEVLGSKMNLDVVDLSSVNSDAKDTKACEKTTAASAEAANDKLLKYTFRRKRKKETMSNANDNAPLEKKNTTKRKTVEKQNSTPEPQKSSLITESSRDSRRLVQVARQLISLSEKRWR